MTDGPRASVLIPSHQRRQLLERSLRALCEQTASSYEVVVALDGCSDGSEEMLAELETPFDLRVLSRSRSGRAAACNAALAAARGEVAIVLDDDMAASPRLVERHLSHHPPGSRLCVMGGVPIVLDEAGPRAARYVQAKFDRHLAAIAAPGYRFGARDFYSGNASLRTEVLREAGGYDEAFTVYGNEDVELSLRLREIGVELRFDGEALAWQTYDKDLPGLAADNVHKGRTTVQLARSHPDVFGELRLAAPTENSRPWLLVRSLLLAATRRRPSLRGTVLAAAARLERLGLWRQPLFYRAVLDYAFWVGVGEAINPAADGGDLLNLLTELERGPIDLLLHG
jgi:GT2 family glycosyltransferase